MVQLVVEESRGEQLATPAACGAQGSGAGCDIWLLGRGGRMEDEAGWDESPLIKAMHTELRLV